MEAKKIIIKTDKPYTENHQTLLEHLCDRKIELFCAWGKHCSEWEDAMDDTIADIKRLDDNHHITTTSHIDEPFEEVLNMAEIWSVEGDNKSVEIIEI
jgi:hypothetical protein